MQPKTEEILMQRVHNLYGMTISELAQALKISVPYDIKWAKGFAGQLIEIALGATAGSNPVQDFPTLGIELKTIPITLNCSPAETTHVCTLHTDCSGQTFEQSNFLNKIKKVLWVPIEGDKSIQLKDRHIGEGFLWEISPVDYQNLKIDWEEIMEIVCLGEVNKLSAHVGTWMQVRPEGYLNGQKQYGFYLRKQFTQNILNNHFKPTC